MSRRERRGTIVVLAIIAILLAGTQIVRSCENRGQELPQVTEIDEFEAATDSVAITVEKNKKEQRQQRSKRSKPHRTSPKKPRPEKPARRLDPVPQF